ncbi:hypothetical protein RchiOBHm_Chr3g0452971 [Rosa chinensis]|uniref:FRIGIDA-like protein n=1 Tax=Rosa chinensis TaxID=74649 RepID=A0A2P6R6G1_ROSCH|nr:putative leucine-rich repeat-containing protein DDB_G0290503 [Rosa chinensis]XP_040372078.1 putative leucine-rich repeat-containing protein DDB_G0290503 [Rosa chinensis]PRQ42008.1 hypothetical protein RchiOBHm_Chr3g0452971 [Rosa chinensis]
MEKIASDLKVSELKQRSLGKAYETLHSQASSILVLSIQWKDLQEHFDSTRNAIRTRFEELQEREKQLEAKESNLKSEMESKKDELFGVEKLIDEKVQEVIDIKRSIQKHSEEIEREEKRVLQIRKLVIDKERECRLIQRRIQESGKKLSWVERRTEEKLNEVECKEKELNKYREDAKLKVEQLSVIDGAIVERNEIIESKEEKLSWIEKSIEEKSKLANSKEEEVRAIQRSLNVYRESIKSKESDLDAILESIEGEKKEFDVKEEQIKTLQRLIEGCEKELKLKEETLKEETLKVKEYSLRNRQMEEWSCRLELKEREVELKEKRLESKMEEFKKWVEERGKDLNSLSSELKVKECQLEQAAKELELTKKQCGVVAQVKIGPLEKTPENDAIVSSSASDQSNINITDGRSLQLFMYEHMKRNDSISNKISSFLQQKASEPAKLVLDAMQGFYTSNLTVENEFDLVLIRRTCILLLEELKRVSPQTNPEVREEAMKLATDWKAKMKVGSENWLEILGFLRLVTTYGLTSAYNEKELHSLLDIVAQHEQATELSRALATTDKAHANSNICSPMKIEKTKSPVAQNEATISSPNLQQAATTIDARNLQGFQNEQFREACDSADSAWKSIIYDLIGKKRLIAAVGLIYTMKLFDKFPPVQILKEYVDNGKRCCRNRTKRKNSLDEKDMITDQHIADLRVVIQCIKDYNLESECPPEEIESQIAALEIVKERRRLALSSLVLKVEQQQKVLKNVEVQEQQEQKASKGEQQEQQKEQRTSEAKLQEKVQQKASNKVEEQQQQQEKNASKVKQQEQQEQKAFKVKQLQKKRNKRPNSTFAPWFDHQQQCKNKFQRTSILADRHPDHPDYPNPSSSTWTHERNGYRDQFGTAVNKYGSSC